MVDEMQKDLDKTREELEESKMEIEEKDQQLKENKLQLKKMQEELEHWKKMYQQENKQARIREVQCEQNSKYKYHINKRRTVKRPDNIHPTSKRFSGKYTGLI